jgi:bile acid:Na+ symporter, BASS family
MNQSGIFFIGIILIMGFVAALFPFVFVGFLSFLPFLLAIVMLFMGITLKEDDMLNALKNWKIALLGAFLQFFLMPLIAYVLGIVYDLSPEFRLGLLLVGCCPGGTASNVIVYLFKGDVPLSVFMTFISTVASVVLTPLLLELYIGQSMDLPTQGLITDIFILVLIPLLAGYFMQRYLNDKTLFRLEKISSVIALIVIAIIIAAIIASSKGMMKTMSGILIMVVILHNGLGLLMGYYLSYFIIKDKRMARTIAIEVGMQNSGLGVVLANLHFTKMVALPSAVFSFWHNVSGTLLANYWRKNNK